MAERIVSPGVFTRERDLSFLPQGISDIGAAIIGPTKIGPAFTPTQITSFQEFEEVFGAVDSRFYTPYTVEQYLRSAGVVTIVRVLGLGGYTVDSVRLGSFEASTGATSSLAILAPSLGTSATADLSETALSGSNEVNTNSSFTLVVSGSGVTAETYSLSFTTSSANFIDKVISSDPQSTKSGANTSSVYVYKVFKQKASTLNSAASASVTVGNAGNNRLNFEGSTTFDSSGNAGTWTGNKDYQFGQSPIIQSQLINSTRYPLFRIYTRSHGTDVNTTYKTKILDIKPDTDIAGSDFGTFSIQVIKHGDEIILEQYDNLTLDPASPNFFAKRIGDRHIEIDSNGKLTNYGDYPNISKYIRVGDFADMIVDGVFKYPKSVVPMGHDKLRNPVPGTTEIPAVQFKTDQTNVNGTFDSSVAFGIDLISDYIKDDNIQYLAPIPVGSGNGNNVTMSLEDQDGNDDASVLGSTFSSASEKITLSLSAIGQRKFIVPFQFGFDGQNPAREYKTGANIVANNTMGFDLSNATKSGSVAYKRAINSISNPDEFDINLLVTPGVVHGLHSTVTNHAISKMEARADAFYLMDATGLNDTIQTVVNTVKTLDSNYVGTYYPWVKILDRDTSRPVFVPPSVVIAGVISNTDAVAHEWFAPAGLNRGGLTSVTEAKTRLTHAERDELYESRINPIASFPGQGVVVFGQKTLQSKPSALDRINVRRLLIRLRKFIASTSRFLVFEQNTQALRNRFLNIVNPFLEQVQSNSGLSAFRVVMDDTNNTPDVVDRNQLVGQIFIQPTRTAEFIVLDFVVQPTGATFPE
tara:strand:+ start:119 stop:2548 length:2430 start_codon:yes stop_codon:yes gene_type:complete